MNITIFYREWKIQATDRTASAAKINGSDRFDCPEQPCFEEALRTVKAGVNEREGPQVWMEGYTNEALL